MNQYDDTDRQRMNALHEADVAADDMEAEEPEPKTMTVSIGWLPALACGFLGGVAGGMFAPALGIPGAIAGFVGWKLVLVGYSTWLKKSA